jgi:hypothetical protein
MQLGLTSVLGLVFIVLKLTGHIHWSWVWVLSPFWIGLILFILVLALIGWLNQKDPLWRLRK